MSTATVPPAAPKGSPLGRILGVATLIGLSALLLNWVMSHDVHLDWADAMAFAITLIGTAGGVRLVVDTFDRKALGARMEVEGDPTAREAGQARLQGIMLLLLAVAMAVPPVVRLTGWGSPSLAYAAVFVFVAARLWYNRRVLSCADEFLQRRVQEAHSMLFMALTPTLMLYAAGERLGLAPQASAWQILVLVTLSTFIVPAIVRARMNREAR